MGRLLVLRWRSHGGRQGTLRRAGAVSPLLAGAACGSGGASSAPRRPQAERPRTRMPATRRVRENARLDDIRCSETWPHHNDIRETDARGNLARQKPTFGRFPPDRDGRTGRCVLCSLEAWAKTRQIRFMPILSRSRLTASRSPSPSGWLRAGMWFACQAVSRRTGRMPRACRLNGPSQRKGAGRSGGRGGERRTQAAAGRLIYRRGAATSDSGRFQGQDNSGQPVGDLVRALPRGDAGPGQAPGRPRRPGFRGRGHQRGHPQPDKPKAWLQENGIRNLAYYADPDGQAPAGACRNPAMLSAFRPPCWSMRPGCEIALLKGPAEWASPDAVAFMKAASQAVARP